MDADAALCAAAVVGQKGKISSVASLLATDVVWLVTCQCIALGKDVRTAGLRALQELLGAFRCLHLMRPISQTGPQRLRAVINICRFDTSALAIVVRHCFGIHPPLSHPSVRTRPSGGPNKGCPTVRLLLPLIRDRPDGDTLVRPAAAGGMNGLSCWQMA